MRDNDAMKWISLLSAVIATGLLAGCMTLSQNDRVLLQQHRVSSDLYYRMMHVDPLSLADIIELSKKQLPPDFIIYYISSTHVAYRLTTDTLSYMRKSGVSKQVLDYLMSSPPPYAVAPYPLIPPVNLYYGPGYYGYYPGYGYPRVTVGGYYGGYYGGYGGPYRHGYWH